MLKSELILTMQDRHSHLSANTVKSAVDSIINRMVDALLSQDRIEIRGFGSFSLHQRGPRHAHNPKTGEKITTKSKRTAHFKPGKELRQRVDFSRLNYPIEVLHEHD